MSSMQKKANSLDITYNGLTYGDISIVMAFVVYVNRASVYEWRKEKERERKRKRIALDWFVSSLKI